MYVRDHPEASSQCLPLCEYLKFPPDRCRFTLEQRQEAYEVFLLYEAAIGKDRKWDESDRTMELLIRSRLEPCANYSNSSLVGMDESAPYDKVYVDEIQDSTQAEIVLFFLCTGLDFQAAFFAGDPAQSG